jgi:hypothetical protein
MPRRLVHPRLDRARAQLVGASPGVPLVVLRALPLRCHGHHDLGHVRLQQLEQPGALRALLQAQVHLARNAANRLDQSSPVRLHHP